ncbi:MAG: hybrid sensor histidine kinase/response regulator, partial [Tannerellaceae bacterium]|nr:hybrid sensor histidine kinase/response regulator [Tannerellaceae bacterium]
LGDIGNIIHFGDYFYLAFKSNGLVKIKKEKEELKSDFLIDIGVFCIHSDYNQPILWVGTDGEGVYMHYDKQEQFGNILLDNLPISIRKPVRSIYTNSQGDLWIGTKGDGIIRIKEYEKYDGRPVPKEQIQHYTVADGLSNNQVFCFLESKYRDLVWIGTQGPGLSYYSKKYENIYTVNSRDRQIQRVHSVCEVNDSTLWIATAGDGLLEVILEEDKGLKVKRKNRYNLKAGENLCNEFHSMSFDGDSTLLIGSRGGYGVVRFNIYTRQYKFLSSLQMDNSTIGDVLSVHQSQDSVYYFGASSGLTKASFRKNEAPVIRQFDKNNGMINDMIHGILEDHNHCIWLSTNKGLTKYNPYNDFFHNYSFPDLKVVEFSDDAYWKCPYTGRLFFGGVNGCVWVDTVDYIPTLYTPILRFFEMKAGEQRISLNGYNVGRERRALYINPDISVFSVSFVVTDYMDGDNYEYSYQLENYTNEWISLQKNNEITFTNLPYGKYTLKVRYKNDVFDSYDYYYPLAIVVLPPWYLSYWALGIYGLCFLAICGFLIWQTKRKLVERQQQITQRIKEEQKEKLYEAKLEFFTNITHELCTPLTLINGINEHIRTYATDLQEDGLLKYSEILSENVKGLNELINEILDFRKIEESGFTRFNIRSVSVMDIITKLCKSYQPVAQDNCIEYQLNIPDKIEWNTDAAYLKK